MITQLYTIDCHQGAPLSTWSEPTPLDEILDRYYEQWQDQTDEPEAMTRKQFTAEMFQDLWDCTLVEAGKRIWINDQDMGATYIKNPWHKGPGVKLINIVETLPF